ncbi:MAG: hypothetical protein PHH93_05125 [Prolixibacteraceae bacterium]|nr:hypothetical protein [Prolixibacteraceae bacterium]
MNNNILFTILNHNWSVFRLIDIALLTEETDFQSLNKKLNYYVHTGKLLNPRRGIYTKQKYNPEELACKIYTPSYISLEYVLQKAGIIFQYDSRITIVSYLSRVVKTDNREYCFRKIKEDILLNNAGIEQIDGNINIAVTERAFLDMIYFDKGYYFDNPESLNKEIIIKLLPVYRSKRMEQRIKDIFGNG